MSKHVLRGTALFILIFGVLFSAVSLTAAQDGAAAQAVEIEMADGLVVKGSFYAAPEAEAAPAVLLLHQLGGARAEWDALVASLTEAGFNVLAVDQRGAGETGADADWALAQEDAAALMGWLREQPTVNPDSVAVIGASIGGNIALRVCAADSLCRAAAALSPGLDFMGVTTDDAVASMEDKMIFLASSQNDPYGSHTAVKALTADSPVSVTVLTEIYANGTEHATQMFIHPDLIPNILAWLESVSA